MSLIVSAATNKEGSCAVIIGASHVTLGCENIVAAIASLRPHGYDPEFIADDVANHASKRGSLSGWSDLHSLALLRSKQGFAIELISYSSGSAESFGKYIGILNSPAAQGASPIAHLEFLRTTLAEGGMNYSVGHIAELDLPVLLTAEGVAEHGLKKIVLPVSDLERASAFWCKGLGYRRKNAARDIAELSSVSPVAAWRVDIVLIQSLDGPKASVLDAKGMACLAFLSSSIENDGANLERLGAIRVTEVFPIYVNGKSMNILVLDFDGAYVELVQVLL